jgi:hypothetical protein
MISNSRSTSQDPLARGRLLVASVSLLLTVAACGGAIATDVATPTAGTPAPSAAPPATAPPSSAAPPSEGQALPTSDGPIQAGTYRLAASPWSHADLTVTVPAGWGVQYGHLFVKHPDAQDELGFYPVLVDRIYADACAGSNGSEVEIGPGVDDLAAALAEQAGPSVTAPMPTTLGGFQGVRLEMTVPPDFDLSTCNVQDVGLQVWKSAPADKYFVLLPAAVTTVVILDIGGRRQVFVAQVGDEASAADRAELQDVLDSIRIEP